MFAPCLSLVLALSGGVEPPPAPTPTVLWTFPLKSHSFGGGAAADVNGDGILDIAFATYFGDASVHVLNGKDGKEIWSYHDPRADRDDCYDASCRFADVNGDGKLDLVVPCSSGCRVLCFDAATGHVNWNTYLGDAECIDTPPWVGPIGGKAQVVVGTFKSKLFVLNGSDGSIARTLAVTNHTSGAAVQSCPLVMDLDKDGEPDFIAATFGKAAPGVYAINAKDGSRLWSVPTPESIYHGPSVCANGERLAIGAYDGKVRFIDAASGEVRATSSKVDRYIMSPTAVLDDGKSETVYAASDHVTALGLDGSVKWTKPVRGQKSTGYESVSRGVAIADMDGDGVADVAYLTSLGLFRVLDSRDGRVLYEFDGAPLLGEGRKAGDGSNGPILADVNGDGKMDAFFVVGGGGEMNADKTYKPRYGVAVCVTGFGAKASATNGWPMFRGNPMNTGRPVSCSGFTGHTSIESAR